MLAIRPVEGSLKPPWWRTALLVCVAFLGTITSAAISPAGYRVEEHPLATLFSLLSLVVAVVGPLALIWRARFPAMYAVAAALISLVVPIGNTLALITLSSLIGRRRGSGVWAVAGLTAATTTTVVALDASARPVGASLLQTILAEGDVPVDVGVATIAILSALGWVLAVGLGLLLRSSRESSVARQTASTERATSTLLSEEVARQAERERIAREVHDVLGHRLSLLSLHAGALEVNSQENERLQASAALVRESAAGAMGDLRSLLAMLRQPSADQPELPLTALPQVVQESFGAGQLLASSIFVADADKAHPSLSRAVYRIVQEVLTNARKHAPGQRVELLVNGGPSSGVVIDVRNPVVAEKGSGASGSRRGLAGVAERAELLGGQVQYGLADEGSTFRVRVELPWREVEEAH